jgi:hypothetical protein
MEPTRANVVGSLRSIGVVAARLILNVERNRFAEQKPERFFAFLKG